MLLPIFRLRAVSFDSLQEAWGAILSRPATPPSTRGPQLQAVFHDRHACGLVGVSSPECGRWRRPHFTIAMRAALSVYPQAKVESTIGGIILRPSPPPVSRVRRLA